ncbi:MAG TPA: DUF2442 domain-containing protein [Puia sp.]|nr:DUF2442 domain-containing protein [Puia sp.]
MSTLVNKYDSIEKLIFDEGLKIKSVKINPKSKKMSVYLNRELVLRVNLSFYSGLKDASIKSLENFRLVANGSGIHWPDLDEDLSLKGFFKDFLKQEVKSGNKLTIA